MLSPLRELCLDGCGELYVKLTILMKCMTKIVKLCFYVNLNSRWVFLLVHKFTLVVSISTNHISSVK
jgi:hypothetical protein